MSTKVLGNPILGFRTSENVNYQKYFEDSEKARLELREAMRKEIAERFG